jgi:hypothetical protein
MRHPLLKAAEAALRKDPGEANGRMAGAHDEKAAVLRFIRSSSAHWNREANKFRGARVHALAIDAEARAAILDQVAVDIEYGQHRRTSEGS